MKANFRRACWFVGALAACRESAPPTFDFLVHVESDPGVPLANVTLLRDEQVLVQSTNDGGVDVALSGRVGENVSIEVQCPEGYRSPEKPLHVTLRPRAEGASKPEYRVTCKPELRNLVITVRAENGAGIPVRYLGRELARVDGDGAAHVLLRVPPGESVTLELDTTGREHHGLSPQNPRFTVAMPDHDEVALFDQPFTKPVVKVVREAKPTGPVPILKR